MTSDAGFQKIIPLLCFGAAAAALIAAGVVLFDSRDELTSSADGDQETFVSYSVEAEEVESSPPDEEGEFPEMAWQVMDDGQEWEVLEPRSDHPPQEESESGEVADEIEPPHEPKAADEAAPKVGGTGQAQQGATGRLIVITNFTRARVTVNGDSYPSYSDDGENRGMELPANQAHEVVVEFDDNQRYYDITLEPGEERMLMVELTGDDGSASRPPEPRSESDRPRRPRPQDNDDDDDIDEDEGRITVYSRPRGDIYVGEENTGEQTPSTVDVDPGRHEVQVRYEGGDMSETKTVRVRGGSRVKLFFRQDD